MKINFIKILLVVACLWLMGCGDQESPSVPSSHEQSNAIENSASADTDSFKTLLSTFSENDLVVESDNGVKCAVNVHLAETWIQDYLAGKTSTLAIFYDGGGFPSSLYLLKSDGTKTYTVSYYSSKTPENDEVYLSDTIIERKLDYVFGADTGMERYPIVHKKAIVEQTITESNAFLPQKTEQIAETLFNTLLESTTNLFCNSKYLDVSISTPMVKKTGNTFWYRSTGTVEISGILCSQISVYSTEAEMRDGEQSGNILAVSTDGELCFEKNVAHGGWIFVWDKNSHIVKTK